MQCNTRASALLAPLALLLAATGCASVDPWERPDPSADPRAAIADVFRFSLAAHPDAPRPEEARIVTVTAEAIVWEPLAEGAGPEPRRALRFADVTGVAFHEEQGLFRGRAPEAIFLYVRGDPEVVARAGAAYQLPGEVDVPLARPFLSLRRRPPSSFARLVQALAALGFAPPRS